MIGRMTEELRLERRRRAIELAGPVGAPGTGKENKRRKSRARRRAKINARNAARITS